MTAAGTARWSMICRISPIWDMAQASCRNLDCSRLRRSTENRRFAIGYRRLSKRSESKPAPFRLLNGAGSVFLGCLDIFENVIKLGFGFAVTAFDSASVHGEAALCPALCLTFQGEVKMGGLTNFCYINDEIRN